MTKPRPPSSVRADRELAEFILSLKKGSYSDKIIRKGIETLRLNMFAGEKIERRKFPKYYIDKYGINNLSKCIWILGLVLPTRLLRRNRV